LIFPFFCVNVTSSRIEDKRSKSMDVLKFSEYIRNIRLSKGLSIPELAKKLLVSRQHWYSIESGSKKVNIELIKKLSLVLDIPIGVTLQVWFDETLARNNIKESFQLVALNEKHKQISESLSNTTVKIPEKSYEIMGKSDVGIIAENELYSYLNEI